MKRIILLTAMLFVMGAPLHLYGQAWKAAIGYDKLVTEVGESLEDGSGVLAAMVEAPRNGSSYMPDLGGGNTGRFFIEGSGASGTSGHATGVGERFFDNTLSMTPGLGSQMSNAVTGFNAVDWIDNQLGADTGADPSLQNFHVSNHSYIGEIDDMFTESDAADVLRRLDFAINQSEMTTVVGTNNSVGTLPAIMVQGYNSITVGRSDGSHAAGLTSNFYGSGRTKPDIVAPESSTSLATPIVSGAAALLHEAGAGTSATRSETMKAILLSGATKDEFASWDRTTTRPLDEVFGAGQVNIYNSYQILQGGEQDGSVTDPLSAVSENGWDYEEELVAGQDLFYEFHVPSMEVMEELSIILTWNMEITDTDADVNVFNPVESLADMNLEFYDSTGSFLGSMVDMSASSVDNVEHIYLQNLTAGTYHLRVSSDINRDFGLAWRSNLVSAVPEPGSASLLSGILLTLLARRRRRSS